MLANDSDPNGDTLTVTGASATNGTVKVNTDGTLTYTPKANFNGNDAISYTVSDGHGSSATASVAVAVAAVNDAPVAQNDTATTHSPVTINVLANDTDVDGDTLTVISASAPHGTTTINYDQTVTYVPNDGFSGQDTLTYKISDGHGGTSTAAVAITVPGDQPSTQDTVIRVRVAADLYNGDPQFQLLIDGQQVGATQDVSAVHQCRRLADRGVHAPRGTSFDQLSIQYSNDAYGGSGNDRNLWVDWVEINGVQLTADEATYVRPGKTTIAGQSGMAWNGSLVFDVSGHSDLFGNGAPVAVNDTARTNAETPVTIDVLANDSDPNHDLLTLTGALASHGVTAINTDGTLTYTPDDGFSGKDTLTYNISDGHGGTASATASIDVVPANASDTVIRVQVAADLYNGDPQFQLLIDGQQVGTTQDVSAVHSAGDWQIVEFTLPGGTSFDQLSIQYNNDAYGGYGSDRNLWVDWVEINGVQLTADEATYVRPGKTTIAGQSGMAWNGSLNFDVSGRNDLFPTVTSSNTGSSGNQAPAAADDSGHTDLNTAVTFDVLANDSDPNGDALHLGGFTQPDHGTVVLNHDGTLHLHAERRLLRHGQLRLCGYRRPSDRHGDRDRRCGCGWLAGLDPRAFAMFRRGRL